MFAIAAHLHVLRSHNLSGNLLEFGCYKGFSTSLLTLACRELGIRMEVFDSFQGLPSSPSAYYQERDFAGSLAEVRKHVSQFGAIETADFHSGFFEQTIATVRSAPLCIWMDVDLATSATDAMQILGLLPLDSCVFSHECGVENFGPDGVRHLSGADDVVGPIVAAFRREGRTPTGRFLHGNTGAFWDRDRGVPVLPVDALLRLTSL